MQGRFILRAPSCIVHAYVTDDALRNTTEIFFVCEPAANWNVKKRSTEKLT